MEIIEFKDYPNTETPLNAHNLNRMQTNIKENITSTKTTSGETLTIEDACHVNSKLDISGNSEQETRNGYNLLNIPSKKTLKGMYSHKLDNIIPNGSKITVSWDSYVLGGEKTPRIRF